MNQPIEQRITKIEQRLDNLERQERGYSFTISDIAHKTDYHCTRHAHCTRG